MNIDFTPFADPLMAVLIRLMGPVLASPLAATAAPEAVLAGVAEDLTKPLLVGVPPNLDVTLVSLVAHPAMAPAATRPRNFEYRNSFFTGPPPWFTPE
ncbi:MAG: hypothetical protein HY000_04165 [Planctomycetes bacterium]|nr:hypothetical protein [Planctomycetota bacterium]